MSDGLISSTKFVFKYIPSDYLNPCPHCTMDPDGDESDRASLPLPIGMCQSFVVAGGGLGLKLIQFKK